MKILHWYYDLMNLYGDYGNIVVLKKHLIDQGIDVILDKKTIGDVVNINEYDFIYIGSGTESKQELVRQDILQYQNDLKEYINNNKVLLASGNALELFGKTIDDKEGLDIVDIKTMNTIDRYTGDVIVKNDEIGELVGFINKCSIINQNENDKLFDYLFKDNNLKDNDFEGIRFNNLFGTHLLGPVLVKNPCFMKYIIKFILNNINVEYKDINYIHEEESYEVTLNALKERMSK